MKKEGLLKMEMGLEGLLRLAWAAFILPIVIASLPSPRVNFLHQFVLTWSGRGKTFQYSKLTLPQKFFCHFYVVAVLWTSVLLLTTWAYAHETGALVSESTFYSNVASYLTGGSHTFSFHKPRSTSAEHRYRVWRSVFLLLLMEVQALRRLYESIYVFNYSISARMHVFGYLMGLFFYTAAPLSLCSNSAPEAFEFATNRVAEFVVKGKNQMPVRELDLWGYVLPLTRFGWSQWIGLAIFLWGSVHQCRCHTILGKLREDKEHTAENQYVIPCGDWFDLVSSAHYLAEIVIYGGLVVASGGRDLTVWLLFGFVVANLSFAAAETHRWYRRKFDNYPINRYAIIPYIY
ncbi:hypothetical protein Nepgr_004650 [Nepenthes gracilis]|uniref:3-oxo-5-alpha-steroid 4-dehydrogenase C-terminal domain-containing protein n=1 Tax=Nepenthes gracilis TaxID=150966 RepID=A0AAD3S284_NEPGR|nr:hypothetical protein Nepgr_004650 [Nepenthes gracilis]